MNNIYNKSYYDSYGFEHNNYIENAAIIATLNELADCLCSSVDFNTHLDIGCAMGYLVRAMTERNKLSRGIDFSEYAIQHADPSIKDLLRLHDIILPIGEYSYDLVTCVEVLEHLKPSQTERAIYNICNIASKYIFCSSNYDTDEATHINIRPKGHWIGLFEQQGFAYVNVTCEVIPWGFVMERIA